MKNYLEKVKEIINKNKKKIVVGTSIFVVSVIGLGVIGVTFAYNKAKANMNYTIEDAKVIALKVVEGEVIRVNKKLELDHLSFEYELKIKDTNNILREVTVDASQGVITDLDNYYD